MIDLLLIAAAGGVGAVVRWLIDANTPRPTSGFPTGITLVNIIGSFVLGVVVGWGSPSVFGVDADLVGVGALGGFTTFSTWMVDIDSADRGTLTAAVLIVPLVLGVCAAGLGVALGVVFGGS